MHIEARLFEFMPRSSSLCAVLYGVLTALFATGGVEWAGTTALVLTGGLALIIGTFFRFVARRLDTRPEDYEGAEISDGAGELGFFSPHSWWPILIALSGSVAAVGIALWLPWLIVAGVVFVLASAAGLVFEYYVGSREALSRRGRPAKVTIRASVDRVARSPQTVLPRSRFGRVCPRHMRNFPACTATMQPRCSRAGEAVEQEQADMSGPNPRDADPKDWTRRPSPAGRPADPAVGRRFGARQSPSREPRPARRTVYSRAYSAPESEHSPAARTCRPNLELYDYDNYDDAAVPTEDEAAARWPWVVGVARDRGGDRAGRVGVAAVHAHRHQQAGHARHRPPHRRRRRCRTRSRHDTATTAAPAAAQRATATAAAAASDGDQPPPPPPLRRRRRPPQRPLRPPAPPGGTATAAHHAPAGPRQVTYSVTGTKAPGDIITVTYVDASGRRRTQHNVYIPWSMTRHADLAVRRGLGRGVQPVPGQQAQLLDHDQRRNGAVSRTRTTHRRRAADGRQIFAHGLGRTRHRRAGGHRPHPGGGVRRHLAGAVGRQRCGRRRADGFGPGFHRAARAARTPRGCCTPSSSFPR